MKKALVTGGAGFIGSELVRLLVKEGWYVVIFDNFSTGKMANVADVLFQRNGAHISPGDIRNLVELTNAARGVDVIFHLAAHVSVRESLVNPDKTKQNNELGTKNVYEAARLNNIKKVVFSSSCSVYPDPLSPYAESKLVGETIAKKYYVDFGIASSCLRYFNVYGAKQSANSQYASVIPKFLDAIEKNQAPTIYGDGEQTRDFIFVEDIAKANLQALDQVGCVVSNVMTGESTSLNNLWKLIANETNTVLVPEYLPAIVGEPKHAIPDESLVRCQLSTTPLLDGLKKTISGRLGSVATATHS